jgi:hypothetical protein
VKVPPELEAALNATGIPWTVEDSKKHRKVMLGGRLATIIPHGHRQDANRRVVLNTIKNVRHLAQKLRDER